MPAGLPVLVVDDQVDVRESLAFLLELKGYAVVTAADGREALGQMRRGVRPGLILLDLMMPDMDGLEFRREQLKDPQLSTVPIVVCSAHPDATSTAERLGAAACLPKPLNIDRLLSLVAAHCAPQRA